MTAEILNKARKYCTYQERSQQELRDKLYELGLYKKDVEQVIAAMVEEGYLNEERFAIAYAGGKFRVKQWGKVKIKLALKQKRVSDYCVKKALAQIPDKDYEDALQKVIAAQSKKITEKNILKKNYKIAQYVIGKGFEPDLVWDVITNI
ncbi:MAG TPA: regulatory protein RecX [Bacteroidia bacterium]|nr:regulatory protein RecX [Bacteroidia bacterium]HNU32340.1 regulatory protein RecX [Bacteroidia bacterium]